MFIPAIRAGVLDFSFAARDRRSGAKPWAVFWHTSLVGGEAVTWDQVGFAERPAVPPCCTEVSSRTSLGGELVRPSAPDDRIRSMDPGLKTLLVDFVEKVGLLKSDMKRKKELERYEARFLRIEQKFSALAELISRDDPELAKALRKAFETPTMSLAFRNAEHQKDLKQKPGDDSDG